MKKILDSLGLGETFVGIRLGRIDQIDPSIKTDWVQRITPEDSD